MMFCLFKYIWEECDDGMVHKHRSQMISVKASVSYIFNTTA
jgi:hypothetical protein